MDNCDLGCTLFAAVPNAGLLRTADSLISITDQRAPAPRTKATLHAAQELADLALLAVMLYTISIDRRKLMARQWPVVLYRNPAPKTKFSCISILK